MPRKDLQPTYQTVSLRLVFGEITLRRTTFGAAVLADEPGIALDVHKHAVEALRDDKLDVVFFPSVHPACRPGVFSWDRVGLWYSPLEYSLHCVRLQGTFGEYLKKFSSSSRKTLRRDWEKFQELSGLADCVREYRAPDEMTEFHRLARAVSALTFQERLLGVGLPDNPAFIDSLRTQAAQDLVRAYVLFDKEHPVAFAFCSGERDRLTYQIIGYDPAYRDRSPGRTLLYVILDKLFAEQRFAVLDFGSGEAFYKSFFATHSVPCKDLDCFRPAPRNVAFVAAQWGLSSVSRTAVRVTTFLGVKERLKKWTRASFGR